MKPVKTKGDKSHLTAITRTKPSAPMRWLVSDNRLPLHCRVLDYGCGRGFDAKHYDLDKYDPCYYPEKPKGPYDLITCNYVLNVIPNCFARRCVLTHIDSLLAESGWAYITVRTDKRSLVGVTSRGTWQGWIDLNLTPVQNAPHYRIYKMFKGESNCDMVARTYSREAEKISADDLTSREPELCLK